MFRTASVTGVGLAVLLAAVVLLLAAGVRAESPAEMLEKGIHLEETVGDLDQAMAVYEQIVKDAESSQRFAAQAAFRLGICHAKKGESEQAIAAFRKVLTDYPGERSVAVKARRELTRLGAGGGYEPVVIRTRPAPFETDVAPTLKEITATFDRPMRDGSWSWTRVNLETWPTTTGEARYDSKRMTCTLPVGLEPGKVYWVGVNAPGFENFTTPDGVPAKPYVILFATRGVDGKPTEIPADLLAQAKEINAKALEVSEKPELKLDPAPWVDGEMMRLKLSTPVGMEVGTMIYAPRAVRIGDKDAWRIETFLYITVQDMEQYTRVDAERDSFAPIFGRTWNSNMGDFRAEYGEGTVKHTSGARGQQKTREIGLKETSYDNEQALYLIRRMPLAEGYRGSFPIFPVMGGEVVECRIAVVGKEKLTAPAGAYECYKVDLQVYSGGIRGLQHDLWFSADEHKYLVKYDSGNAVMELTEVTTRVGDRPTDFNDKELGIALTVPAGWLLYQFENPRPHSLQLKLIPPEMKAWSALAAAGRDTEERTARLVADGDIEVLKGHFKGYVVRPESWTEVKVADLEASRYVADYQDEGKSMVEYRTYILDKAMVYWFVFRIEADQFEANRAAFDEIVNSLRVSAIAGTQPGAK
jgi:hypothetical protein